MADLKTRLRTKFFRRHSGLTSSSPSTPTSPNPISDDRSISNPLRSQPSASSLRNRVQKVGKKLSTGEHAAPHSPIHESTSRALDNSPISLAAETCLSAPTDAGDFSTASSHHPTQPPHRPTTPIVKKPSIAESRAGQGPPTPTGTTSTNISPRHSINGTEPHIYPASTVAATVVSKPFGTQHLTAARPVSGGYFGDSLRSSPPGTVMTRRKVWIKRPGASPTTVAMVEDDLVDDLRDMVLRKYANSLGRTFDAPDVTLKIIPRERSHDTAERFLSPEESIHLIIDTYFPGGQTIDEALVVDIPQRRTPRPSPRAVAHTATYFDEQRPAENGTDYFPPVAMNPPNHHSVGSQDSRLAYQPSISVLETGHLPALPSPREGKRHHRPKNIRQHTSSPTIIGGNPPIPNGNPHRPSRGEWSRTETSPADLKQHGHIGLPPIAALPSPPIIDTSSVNGAGLSSKVSTPPLERVSSPRPGSKQKLRKSTNMNGDSVPSKGTRLSHGSIPAATPQPASLEYRKASASQAPQLRTASIEPTVPPINVLIVEDNPINLRLLEMFTKRLKVRWQTAMNGRDAVTRWRSGGFHLVLMDIQLPIMSGLEATKEIRRLERVNGIGVFAKPEGPDNPTDSITALRSSSVSATDDPSSLTTTTSTTAEGDKLAERSQFKSPVIIVALTASSLQSDRHEALAAGCNDFLTKPVHFNWLERKIMEWGCMQALIDFDGWRKWKDMAKDEERAKEEKLSPEDRRKQEKKEARRAALLAKMGQG